MHVIAFDFDGVLCDSSREVFVVAVDALSEQVPESSLLPELKPLRDDALGGGEGFRDHPLYHQFLDLLPLGNRAEDFGVALRAIEEARALADQTAYDLFYAEIGPQWRDEFHHRFYAARGNLRASDPQRWLGLHLPYPELVRAFEQHKGAVLPAVATAKDTVSVQMLLEELGLNGVFDPHLILDKETGTEKTHHLRELQRRTGANFHDITFVDDKVNHLVRVAELGVAGVLAGWGFNTERERALARRLGFEVAELDDLDTTVFKGA